MQFLGFTSRYLTVVRDEDGNETIFYKGKELLHTEAGKEAYWKDVVQALGFVVDVIYKVGDSEENK